MVDVCEEYQKEGKLIRLLEEIMRSHENKTIIFTETKRKADDLTGAMRRDGWPSLCIHGDKKQAEREWVLEGNDRHNMGLKYSLKIVNLSM